MPDNAFIKMGNEVTKKYIDELTYKIIGAAIEVHKIIGPGLLEGFYHKCMKQELTMRKIPFASELLIDVSYKAVEMGAELRCDFLVDDLIVVEIKSVDVLIPIFDAQILTYMRLLDVPKGILINFNSINISATGKKPSSMNFIEILLLCEPNVIYVSM